MNFVNAITTDELNKMCHNSLIGELNITFTDIGTNSLSAQMRVERKHMQPFGVLHGGMNCVLAETVGGAISAFYIDLESQVVFGQTITTTHLKSVSSGVVKVVATPIKLGKSSHTINIETFDEDGEITSTTTLVNAVRDKR